MISSCQWLTESLFLQLAHLRVFQIIYPQVKVLERAAPVCCWIHKGLLGQWHVSWVTTSKVNGEKSANGPHERNVSATSRCTQSSRPSLLFLRTLFSFRGSFGEYHVIAVGANETPVSRSAFKLFKNIMAWQGTLADSLLVELALDRLLNRFPRLDMNHD